MSLLIETGLFSCHTSLFDTPRSLWIDFTLFYKFLLIETGLFLLSYVSFGRQTFLLDDIGLFFGSLLVDISLFLTDVGTWKIR